MEGTRRAPLFQKKFVASCDCGSVYLTEARRRDSFHDICYQALELADIFYVILS